MMLQMVFGVLWHLVMCRKSKLMAKNPQHEQDQEQEQDQFLVVLLAASG